jgi:hypothetical protein
MSVASGPVSAIFLILVATSMAVVVSMIVVALFDRAFKQKPSAAKDQNHKPSELPERMPVINRAKAAKSFPAFGYHSKVRHQSGCGPQTQRVRNFV